MSKKKQIHIPLIVEEHPLDYNGYPFITMIEYRNNCILGIVDDTSDKMIKVYVLDLCGPNNINEEQLILIARDWHINSDGKYPISFEFSKRGKSEEMMKIYQSFPVNFVTRVIGPLPRHDANEITSIKRRRRKILPESMIIVK